MTAKLFKAFGFAIIATFIVVASSAKTTFAAEIYAGVSPAPVLTDPAGSAGNPFVTIQEAIDAAAVTPEIDTIKVYPGNYSETASNKTVTSMGSAYQFGLFVGTDNNGLTIEGLNSTGNTVTNPNAAEVFITPNATNNFGPSGIFVEGDNVTIQGIELLPNTGSENKSIEVIGDNFTLQYSKINVPEGNLYINDFEATNTSSTVNKYNVINNVFAQGSGMSLASGAGAFSPASDRQITGNKFEGTSNDYARISFNGSGGQPWYVYTVGGAVISGNTFEDNNAWHIRARGTYDNSQFDWNSYLNGNTFTKGSVVTLETGGDIRPYDYSTYTNVRRIGSSIQAAIDAAQTGDTVKVGAGIYLEDVNLNKEVTLQGAGVDVSTIKGTKTSSPASTVVVANVAATIDGFTVTRDGNNAVDWNTPLKSNGVIIYGNGATLKNSKLTGNRNGLNVESAQNVTIDNVEITNNRTGIQFVNSVSDVSLKNSKVTNNWTMGILFRNETGPQTTINFVATNNDISGNWYSQIESRYDMQVEHLDFKNNWFGVIPPTYSTNTSGEPGYAAQIPVEFGGTATAPASQVSTIAGVTSELIDTIPFCNNNLCSTATLGGGGGGSVDTGTSSPSTTPSTGTTAAPSTGDTAGQVLGAESFRFTITLRYGSIGDEVTELQKVLGDLYKGKIDGIFGPLTRAAVKAWQKQHGLVADGIVGPKTRAELNK